MSQRKVLIYPQDQKALRSVSDSIHLFDHEVKALIQDLKDTLTAHPEGIGLAAPQINVHKRVVIVRMGLRDQSVEERKPPQALVNPIICQQGDHRREFDGCLSFPGLYGETVRPHYLSISWLNETGRPRTTEFHGFDAVLVHHEIDHLDGVLFIDRIERKEDLFRIGEDEFGHTIRLPTLTNPLEGSRPIQVFNPSKE
jgi:peptide deformylase